MHQWIRKASTFALVGAIVILMINIITTSIFQPRPAKTEQVASVGDAVKLPAAPRPQPIPIRYIEIIDSCGPYHDGACVVARTGPGENYPKVDSLRTGMILETSGTTEGGGRTWYKITFNEWMRYPDRIGKDLYVAADYVAPFFDQGLRDFAPGIDATSSKRILIDRSEQILYAYDGDTLFVQLKISTGLEFTPTPRGNFTVYRKTPTRYMQGPIPGITDQYYDLPGVPWNLYFTEQGAVIHGAYWHDQFGKPWSHGCVNLPPQDAKRLYQWTDLGTPVTVRD